MIRLATADDLGALVSLAAQMHAESTYACLTFAPEKVAAAFAQLIAETAGFIMLAEKGGVIVGFVTASAGSPYFSNDIMVTEQLVYMAPAHRGTITSVRLLMAFVHWAKQWEPKLITAGITTGISMRASTELYERVGFELMGFVFKWSDD